VICLAPLPDLGGSREQAAAEIRAFAQHVQLELADIRQLHPRLAVEAAEAGNARAALVNLMVETWFGQRDN